MPWKYKKDNAAYSIRYREERPDIVLWSSAKHRAKVLGIPFSITLEDILIPEFCPILGIRLERNKNTRGPRLNSPTLDRRDNELGYVPGNIAVISYKANTCKSDLTKEQLKKLWEYA